MISSYAATNGLMIASVLCSLAVGNIYGLPGSVNTASTFLSLWGLEKYREFHFANKLNSWV